MTFADHKLVRGLRDAFRQRLLPPTIAHCALNIPAFGHLLDHGVEHPFRLDNLRELPITQKEEMRSRPEWYRDPKVPTTVRQFTSGTTGRRLEIHRGHQEIEFIRSFFSAVNDSTWLHQVTNTGRVFGGNDYPTVLSLPSLNNGAPTPIPYPGPVTRLRYDDPIGDLLAAVDVPDPEQGRDGHARQTNSAILIGLESYLRVLTFRLLGCDFDFGRSRVQEIVTTGDLLTRRLRNWYESVWKVPVRNRYGMTEIFGGASQCPACRSWHLDPHVIPEVVDINSRQPIEKGDGALLLTTLYPFVQKQPFIRYWTGDLVEICEERCEYDSLGFHLRGRLANCVIMNTHQRSKALIFAADVYDLLDEFPDVGSSRMFTEVADIPDHSWLGHLKFRFEQLDEPIRPPNTLNLRIELRYVPEFYPERCRQLEELIRGELLARHRLLASMVSQGDYFVNIIFEAPGELSSFMPDEPE